MTYKESFGDKVKALFEGWRESLADAYGSSKRGVKDAGDKAKNRAEEQIEKGGH